MRALAALLALAAGAVHLAQIGVHIQEGWHIAAFFLILGVIQVMGAALLLRPLPQPWFWIGIAGSVAVIGIWVISRTVGVPFVDDGQAEPVGVADAFASLAEAWTIIILGLYLAEPIRRWRGAIITFAAGLLVSLAVVWVVAAGRGIFDDDPARFRAALPPLIDWLVAASGFGLAGGLLVGALAPPKVPWVRAFLRGLVGAVALVALAQVWLTLPPTIGQNLDCRYAPLSTVLAGPHAAQEPVTIGDGEDRILPIFDLHVCESVGDLALERVEPKTVIGGGAAVGGFWLLPPGIHVKEDGQEELPAGASAVPPGRRITARQPRELVVRLIGTGGGNYILGSVRLVYRTAEAGSFTFASQIAVCSGRCSGGVALPTSVATEPPSNEPRE